MTTIKIEDCDFIRGKFLFYPVRETGTKGLDVMSAETLSVIGKTKTVDFIRNGIFDKEKLAINVWSSLTDDFVLFNWYYSGPALSQEEKEQKFITITNLWIEKRD